MKNIVLSFVLALALVSCGSSTREYVSVRPSLDLSGEWVTPLGAVHLPGTMDEARLAPRNLDTLVTANLTRIYPYRGKMMYSKEIQIPKLMEGKRLTLEMERTKPSVLWIDGDSIGYISCLESPHIYDVTGKLSSEKHTLKISVDNADTSVPQGIQGSHAWTDATQTNWNGIVGKFRIEAMNSTYIKKVSVFPLLSKHAARIHLVMNTDAPATGKISVEGHAWNTTEKSVVKKKTFGVEMLQKGEYAFDFTVDIGKKPCLWSEFSPALYKLNVTYRDKNGCDNRIVDFGMRDFSVKGTQFSVNGLTTFLRGTHDGCVFPLTGYAPMNLNEWTRYFKILKEYGFNHVRCHSWTIPDAAFEAADRAGMYLQVELPYWGSMDEKNVRLNEFLMAEGERILETYGNHPSFTQLALGNELSGDVKVMRKFVEHFRSLDSRHLYAFGSNNWLGTEGYQQGEDYYVTCRVGRDTDSLYTTHVRSSFSFADAYKGGIINGCYPNTEHTYSGATKPCPIPVISHESGQFQIYPDYSEISKYKGVLYPYNLEIFRKRLEKNGLSAQAEAFHRATGAFVSQCYKEDFEMCLRTPGFGGYQFLDLKDYPGQGSALVGLLDAFMDPKKGAMDGEHFRRFNSAVVPMAEFPTYCLENTQTLKARIVICNYSEHSIENKPLQILLTDNEKTIYEKKSVVSIPQGVLRNVETLQVPLTEITKPAHVQLTLNYDGHQNDYELWVYPPANPADDGVKETTVWNEEIQKEVEDGATVLYIPEHKDIEKISVDGLFTPDYWNYAMFKGISENLKREVSPGTLSLLVDPTHPLFKEFPTEIHSNWQWWSICRFSRPMILNALPKDYFPLIQIIDNVERNHKLGILFEFCMGKGKLMICTCNLNSIQDKPEGRQFKKAILDYMQSKDFFPLRQIDKETWKALFAEQMEKDNIKGVKNITSYE